MDSRRMQGYIADNFIVISRYTVECLYKLGADCVALYVYYMKVKKWGNGFDTEESIRKDLGFSTHRFEYAKKLLEENGFIDFTE